MHCTNCNSKINENEKYCSNCGKKIITEKEGTPSRVALKENAKKKPKKSLIITTLILMIISAIFDIAYMAFEKINITLTETLIFNLIGLILISLLLAIYIFDMYGGAIKISRNIKLTPIQVLTKFTKRPKNSITLILVMLIMIFLICSVAIIVLVEEYLDIFMPAFVVIFIALAIYILPIFEMLLFILADEKNKNRKLLDCIKEAVNLPKGKRMEYYGLELSFIWLHILSLLTLGILYIWLYPYIVLSEANLYRKWNGEEVFLSNKKEISNPNIIFISVFFIIFVSIIIYILFPKYESMSTDEYATIALDDQKITFKVPDNCELVLVGDTDDYSEYSCNNNNDFISYSIQYHFKDDFKDAKNSTKKEYEKEVYDVKLYDYQIKINGKLAKVFYLNYKTEKNGEDIYRDTYVFYRLSQDIDVQIVISINDINKNNIKDYIQIEK